MIVFTTESETLAKYIHNKLCGKGEYFGIINRDGLKHQIDIEPNKDHISPDLACNKIVNELLNACLGLLNHLDFEHKIDIVNSSGLDIQRALILSIK